MTTGATPQERLAWLKANQPNNLEAIAALERRLGVHGVKRPSSRLPEPGRIAGRRMGDMDALENPVVNQQIGCDRPTVDTDFYTELKALHAKTGQTVYQCCKRLGLQTGSNSIMDEAERMVCRLTMEGRIVWHGSLPIFQ